MKKNICLLLILAVVVLVAGCSGANKIAEYLYNKYPLVDVRYSRYTDEEVYTFHIPGSLSEAALDLAKKFEPTFMTQKPNNERMVLVYENIIVDFYKEDNKAFAEVASKQYVRDHYDAGDFFRGYLTATIIRDIMDGPRHMYGGYSPVKSRKAVSDFGKSVRQGSVGSKNVTGGGLFGGK